MSDRYGSRRELANKIEYEGGLAEALDYGIKASDMPEGDDELTAAWAKLDAAWADLKPHMEAVENLLPFDDEGEG